MDYDERLCKKQQEKNDYYLEVFEKDLIESGLKSITIRRHLANVDFYINQYLLREMPNEMQVGCGSAIDMFLGDYFIHKCMWSTPETIKSTAASIKKFYSCMNIHGYLANEDFMYLCTLIKENIKIWQDDCDEYNNGNHFFMY